MFLEITHGTPYNRSESRSLSRSIWANGSPSHGRSSCNTADRRFEPQARLMGILCAPFCPQSCLFQPLSSPQSPLPQGFGSACDTEDRGYCSIRNLERQNGSWSTTALQQRSEEHTSELQSRENLVCRL